MHLRELIDARLEGTTLRSPRWEGEPYRAFDVFDLEHAEIFFGREEEVADLEARLRRRRDCAFVVVVGASGSGKSSLVRAGLASTLQRSNFDESIAEWRTAVLVPGACDGQLLLGLARSLCSETALPELRESGLAPEALAESFAESPQSALRLAIAPAFQRAAASRSGAVKLLLIVDQLEELHTDRRLTAEVREQLYRCLHALASSGHCWVVATLRSDFYAFVQQDRAFLELKGSDGQMDLLRPEPSALRRMIAEPARLAALTWERDERTGKPLDQILLDDATAQPDALPLLEFALHELFQRRSGRTLTVSSYRSELGGLEGAVGRRAEAVFGALPVEAQAALPNLLRDLVTLDPETESRPVRRRSSYDPGEGQSPLGGLTTALVAARLLTGSGVGGRSTISLAHEALLTSWDRLHTWVKANLAHLRLRTRVESDYERWRAGDQDPSLLLPEGLRLEEARNLLSTAPELLSSEIKGYIERSIEQQAAIVRRSQRARAGVITTLSVLLIATLGLVYFVNRQRQESNLALARNYLSRANQVIAESPGKGLFWLAQGIRVAPDDTPLATNLRIGFRQITKSHPRLWQRAIVAHDSLVTNSAFSPDGTRIVTASWDGTARVWDAATGQPIGEPLHHENRVNAAAFSPDGTRIVTASLDHTARVWDAATGQPIGEPLHHEDEVYAAAFSPDGTRIVTASWDETARVWDAATGQPIGEPLHHDLGVNAAAFSPDGTRVVTASQDKTARVWDILGDSRPNETITLMGEVASGQTLTADGALRALSGREIAERHLRLRALAPDLFSTQPSLPIPPARTDETSPP